MLQPICYLLDRPKCFRLGRTSPVGIYTRGFNVPSQGTHNNNVERFIWVPRETLIAEWKASYGWAVTPIYTPAAPLPQ